MKTLSILLALLLLGCSSARADGAQREALELFSVNVRKADCHILSLGDVHYMIDTGRKANWLEVSRALRILGISRLDGVVLTHTHSDHAGGAAALASSGIEVGAWYAPKYYTDVKEGKHPAVNAAALAGREVVWIGAGDELPFGSGTLTVLGPAVPNDGKENCNSAVLLAKTEDGSILLAGDMEFPEEETLLERGLIEPCTVLKVGNHAERDATGEPFVRAAAPKLAVISTNSEDEPDTPAPRVLALLEKYGAETVCTQDSELGVLVTVKGGEAFWEYRDIEYPCDMPQGIRIAEKDALSDTVRVENAGDAEADIGGWYLFSEKGGEVFVFPAGTALPAGGSLTVGTQSTSGAYDLLWPDKNVWHDKKDDAAYLYDPYGRLASGMP